MRAFHYLLFSPATAGRGLLEEQDEKTSKSPTERFFLLNFLPPKSLSGLSAGLMLPGFAMPCFRSFKFNELSGRFNYFIRINPFQNFPALLNR